MTIPNNVFAVLDLLTDKKKLQEVTAELRKAAEENNKAAAKLASAKDIQNAQQKCDRMVATCQKKISKMEEEAEAYKANEVDGFNQRLEQFEEAKADAEKRFATQRKTLATKKKNLDIREAELDEKAKELTALEAKLENRRENLAELGTVLEAKQKAMEEFQRAMVN